MKTLKLLELRKESASSQANKEMFNDYRKSLKKSFKDNIVYYLIK